jgi:death-on-curing protein
VSDETGAEEPRWLTEAMLMMIHAQQVERYGGAHGILDPNVVRSALARPINRWAYDQDADLADLAASYLVGFARSQGFDDGNKRTGLAPALVRLPSAEWARASCARQGAVCPYDAGGEQRGR